MKEFWNKRFSSQEYVYGNEPNEFFKETLEKLNLNGKILFPAEGEGRNAVYAAKNGIDVFAFDQSIEAKKKAIKLADLNNVNINYEVASFNEISFKNEKFDAAVFIAAHFPEHIRETFHRTIASMLKNGGYLILEAFSKNNFERKQKNPNVGGPSKLEMLYSLEQIKNDFADLETIFLEEKEVHLNEGQFHSGDAIVIRYIGIKKE